MRPIHWCKNCIHWHQVTTWQGNCDKHPWEQPKFSQDADALGCDSYEDKYAKYQVASAKEA